MQDTLQLRGRSGGSAYPDGVSVGCAGLHGWCAPPGHATPTVAALCLPTDITQSRSTLGLRRHRRHKLNLSVLPLAGRQVGSVVVCLVGGLVKWLVI